MVITINTTDVASSVIIDGIANEITINTAICGIFGQQKTTTYTARKGVLITLNGFNVVSEVVTDDTTGDITLDFRAIYGYRRRVLQDGLADDSWTTSCSDSWTGGPSDSRTSGSRDSWTGGPGDPSDSWTSGSRDSWTGGPSDPSESWTRGSRDSWTAPSGYSDLGVFQELITRSRGLSHHRTNNTMCYH